MGKCLDDLTVCAEVEDFRCQTAARPLVVEGNAADADEYREQFEMQVRNQLERLPPIRTHRLLAP